MTQKPTILVIEDDPASARLAKVLLAAEGYDVALAPDGLKGFRMARDDAPDLILLDLMLPGQDGFEVLNRLRAEPKTASIPVIVLSAKAQQSDKQTATKMGASGYLSKPYNRAELTSMIGPLLAAKPEKAGPRGTCVVLVGSRGGEETLTAVGIGLALAVKQEGVALVDFRPFSVEHAGILDVPPSATTAGLSDVDEAQLSQRIVHHSSGLRLLNNLEGSGEAGQLTPSDVHTVLDMLLAQEGFVLAQLSLYPVDPLRRAVGQCDTVLLVTQADPTLLAAARSALTLLNTSIASGSQLGIVLVGLAPEDEPPELGHAVIGCIPAEAALDHPAFGKAAERLHDLI